VSSPHHVHVCPRCHSPAYVGLRMVDCSREYCRHHVSLRRLGVLDAEQVESLWIAFDGADPPDAKVILCQIADIVEGYYADGGE